MLPAPVRRKFGLKQGDVLEVSTEQGRIVVTPVQPPAPKKGRIKISPATGLPAFFPAPGTPPITMDMIQEVLADFP